MRTFLDDCRRLAFARLGDTSVGADDQLALVGEEHRGPLGVAAIHDRRDGGPQNVLGVASALDDAADDLEHVRRAHRWNASICSRKAVGTGTALRSSSAMQTSVAFAVDISV